MDYSAGSDEFGSIRFTTPPAKDYRIGDKLEVIVPHCDPVVNEYDQIYGIRKDRVDVVWPDHRPRQVAVTPVSRELGFPMAMRWA